MDDEKKGFENEEFKGDPEKNGIEEEQAEEGAEQTSNETEKPSEAEVENEIEAEEVSEEEPETVTEDVVEKAESIAEEAKAGAKAEKIKEKKAKKQKKEKIADDRRIRKALRSYNHRVWKNLLIWVCGLFSCILMLVGGIILTLGVIPVKTFVGEEEAGKIAEGSILEAVMNINSYTFSDVPVAKDLVESLEDIALFEGKTLGDFIKIKIDNYDTVKISDFVNQLGENPGDVIEIVATIDGVAGAEALGDLGRLNAFSTFDVVTEDVDPTSADFVPALYYYKEGDVYMRAFDNEGNRLAPTGATLYYAALAHVPIPDALGLISERIGREKITNLLSSLGGASFGDGSLIVTFLGDTTVSGIGDISLDDIELNAIIPEENNEALYDILRGACVDNLGPDDPITIQNVANGLNMERIKLSNFLDVDEYEMFFNLLCEALDTNPDDNISIRPEDITIADLGSFDLTNAKVYALLGEKNSENETIYNLLCSATGVSNYKELSVSDLSELDLGDIYLIDIIADTPANDAIYDIIMDLNPGVPKNKLKIDHLAGVNFNNMLLSSVIDNEELLDFISTNLGKNDPKVSDLTSLNINTIKIVSILPYDTDTESIYNLILSCYPGKEAEDLTFDDFKSFDLNDVKLKDILGERSDNLYAILAQASGTDENSLTVASLSSFDIGNVDLSIIIEDNGSMFKILREATGKNANATLTVSDLGDFEVNRISLASVLPNPEAHLRDLIEDACDIHPYENIKLSHLTGATFDIDKVYLCHIMDPYDNLKNILEDVYGIPYEQIKFGHIHDVNNNTPFDVTKIHLSTVLTSDTGNTFLDTLRKDDSVTIGNLGEKLDNLSLYEIYGKEAFTTNVSLAVDNTRKFKKTTVGGKDQFVLDNAGTYYINKNAGIWLILCYDESEPQNGRATKFVQSDLDVASMQSGGGITEKFSNAKIGELIDAGIITADIDDPAILQMTFSGFIEEYQRLKNLLG